MRIAVFEDDREFAARLENLIRKHTHHPTAINTGDADELIRWIKKTAEPVLYLLDIVTDGNTAGFRIARQIAEQHSGSMIVFITAYPKSIQNNPVYKTQSFSVILKENPALEQEIIKTLSLAEQVFQDKCLLIHTGRFQTHYIPYKNIYFIEAVKNTNKLCVHCTNGQHVIRDTLKRLHDQLAASGFVRCHKSIIVNRANIRKRDKSNMTLTFYNGESCPYSYLMKGGLDSIDKRDNSV